MTRHLCPPRRPRSLWLHRLLQLFLLGLLLLTALHFQQLFAAQGRAGAFLGSVLASLALQAALFLPIRSLAAAEAKRELAGGGRPSPEQTARLRQQRLFSDLLKVSLFCFFLVFVVLAPPATPLLCTVFFSYTLGLLSFLQCRAFALRQHAGV